MGRAFEIDEELAAFLVQPGNGMMVATRSAALDPHAVRACGVEVLDRTSVAVFVPKATGAPTKRDLENNGDIAVTFSSVADLRGVQLKGKCLRAIEASADDVLLCEDELRGFSAALTLCVGCTRQQARNLWLFDLWRIELRVSSAYVQTPGPGAGAPRRAAHG